jgi:hypothetical protein
MGFPRLKITTNVWAGTFLDRAQMGFGRQRPPPDIAGSAFVRSKKPPLHGLPNAPQSSTALTRRSWGFSAAACRCFLPMPPFKISTCSTLAEEDACRRANGKRFNWDLRSAFGFWNFLFIFMRGITGVLLVFPQPFQDFAAHFTPINQPFRRRQPVALGDKILRWPTYLHFGNWCLWSCLPRAESCGGTACLSRQ